jgi:hypothetical protein
MAKGDYDQYIDVRTGNTVSGTFVRNELIRGVDARYFIHAHPQTDVERRRKKKYLEQQRRGRA